MYNSATLTNNLGILTMAPLKITHFETKISLAHELAKYGIGKNLLTVGTDAKTVKGEKLGYTTAILYLKPDLQLCPMSEKAGCDKACLVSAGRGRFNSVKTARLNKSKLYRLDPELFFSALVKQISDLQVKHGSALVVRLNGTSDLPFHLVPIEVKGIVYQSIMDYFKDVQFYDYTKVYTRASHALPANYDLTLSYSEANSDYANKVISAAIKTGKRVSVVFNGAMPSTYKGFNVIDGDDTDLRFLDDSNCIVGLKAKGEAKKDTSGFVIHTEHKTQVKRKSFKNPPAFKGRYYAPEYMLI